MTASIGAREKAGKPVDVCTEDFDAMRDAGLDLKTWLFTRYVFSLSGPVAESKFTNTPIDLVLTGNGAVQHVNDIRHDTAYCRCEPSEEMANRAVAFLEQAFARADVWAATLALADMLKLGTTPGKLVLAIIAQHLKSIPVPAFEKAVAVPN